MPYNKHVVVAMTTNLKNNTRSGSGNSSFYKLKVNINCVDHELETDDLFSAIMSLRPKVLKTRVLLNITRRDGATCEKQIMVRRARMMFDNSRVLNMFIRQLIFKPLING